MLIETPYKVGDTVSLKLISSEELIARLESEEGDTYTLIKPLAFMMGPQGLGLVPFMFSASKDAKISINKDKVVCIMKTVDDVAKQYIKQTTGIQMVGA